MKNGWLQRIADWVLGREEARVPSSEMEELYQQHLERDGKEAADRRNHRRLQCSSRGSPQTSSLTRIP